VLREEALASVPRAITALISQERSLLAARKFVRAFFLSRQIDLRGMLKFTDPKKALAEMVLRFNRERPKSRLLKETGRFSNSPPCSSSVSTPAPNNWAKVKLNTGAVE
jgi:large subunit ribosomal protein L44